MSGLSWCVGDWAERIEDHLIVKAGERHQVTEMFRGGYLGFAPPVGGEWNPAGWRLVSGPKVSVAPEPKAPACDLDAAVGRIAELESEVTRLRDVLLGIAESDHYRRYPRQHEDGGIRGQSGLRAVRALTGKHGSLLNDDEVRANDNNRRSAMGLPEAEA